MSGLLIVFLVLGALGLFLALPGGRSQLERLGLVLLAAAGGALVWGLARLVGGEHGLPLFLVCSVVGLFAAIRVLTHRKPVYSALYFVLLVIAVTGLLLLMQAEFLALALVIVYAGAILVTYVFVIMLAQQQRAAPYDTKARDPFWGCLAGFALLATITARVFEPPAEELQVVGLAPNLDAVAVIGTPLLTEYVVALQLAGVLLLVAMVGAIAIARRKPPTDSLAESED